jgi:AhpD family alkylhydroperoxidase
VLIHDWPLWKKYSLEQSAIPGKYRELGGLAVAANIKCPYCQLMHTAMAQFHGATQEELAEEYFLASLTARWSAMIHAQNYDWDTFAKEAEQMGGTPKKKTPVRLRLTHLKRLTVDHKTLDFPQAPFIQK